MVEQEKLYCRTLGCRMAYTVKSIMRSLNKRFSEEGIGLTLEQYFILNILDNKEGLILQDLAEIVDRDKSAVLRHIDGLEKSHFVARVKDPEDNRRKLLLITKPGMKELERARKLDQRLDNEITQYLTAGERDKLESNLSVIYKKAMSDL